MKKISYILSNHLVKTDIYAGKMCPASLEDGMERWIDCHTCQKVTQDMPYVP